MRMSLIESDLKSRIEEEIREMAERRASEIIEDHLAKTAESPCAERPPVRAVAPTLMEEEIIEAVKAPPPVRSVPPVAYETQRSVPPPAYSQPPPAYSSPPTALYSSPPGPIYSQASYSSPPPPYSAPPPAYSQPPPAYSQPPPRSSYGPPSSHPSMHPASMHPASIFPHSTPNYIVWPEVAEPTLRGAVEAAPRRSNALLMAVAALALGLSGAAFAASTGHLGNATASAAPVTKPLTHIETATGTAPQAEDPSFATAPAPTLASPNAPANDAPRWSRRYKGPDAQLAPTTPAAAPAAAAKPAEKAATKDVKDVKETAPVAQPEPVAAPPPAPPAPSMDQANKTAEMLREQLNSSVK